MSTEKPKILLVGGTSRPGSATERALGHARRWLEEEGAEVITFEGGFLSALRLYDPENDERSDTEKAFVEAVRECDGIIIATPAYHGSISGPIKNALDWIEDTARDDSPYLTNRAFGCIVVAYGWQACGTALVSLRLIAHALRAWPTPMGATINSSEAPFDDNGICTDTHACEQMDIMCTQVLDFARYRRSRLASAS